MAWLLGARVVFIETMARVSGPSKTGWLLSKISVLHIVQWRELAEVFPDARLCRPVLLPDVASRSHEGHGTFVSVGTHSEPFDRLLRAVDRAVADGALPRPCQVQAGTSNFTSSRMTAMRTMPPAEFERCVGAAEFIVGHCGAGLVSSALRAGHRPILMARRVELQEHVDDHQYQLARKLASLDLAVLVETSIDREVVEKAARPIVEAEELRGLPDADATIVACIAPLRESWRR